MSTLQRLYAGLSILIKYQEGHVCTHYDSLMLGDPAQVSPEDLERLKALGFTEHEEGCFVFDT